MTRDQFISFIGQHKLGVLATISPMGEPESAVVAVAVTDRLELVFDTVENSRKCVNLRQNSRIAFVIGWDKEITAQIEGMADEPKGEELTRIQKAYFAAHPDAPGRLSWPGITYFRVKPHWIRYSDFNPPQKIVEFKPSELV